MLILGDSISIGYTSYVQRMLANEAVVKRPTRGDGPENCQGTTYGREHVDRWLAQGDGSWDVIHFNFGLHDLKRVDPASGAASTDPEHPRQAELTQYESQLEQIVEKLKTTGARLVFATTTPVPAGGVRPYRDVEDPQRYNDAARRIMRRHGVEINDLYTFAAVRLDEIQRPANVHFTDAGSKALAGRVVSQVRRALEKHAVTSGTQRVASASRAGAQGDRLPNFVIIYIDDMGYGDIGSFGAQGYETPNLDRMAREGRVFTDFYVTQAVCSASRAGLLTGCYNVRVGILGALSHSANHGIHADEMTLAELVKQKDYATACFGKWHLGHHPKFLPTRHGFDEYYGLPYSNDMWPFHPTAGNRFCHLPLFENSRVIDTEVTGEDQEELTSAYTERAVDFIERNKQRPFLLYVPHTMVHVPLYVSDKFRGKSKRGLFGDVVMELDWSVGEILETLRKHHLDEHTMVVFTSDNGPWLSYGDHAGSAGPLREGKGTMFDGGCREPMVMWWPGRIPAGSVSKTPAMTIDLLPTIAHLIGAALPSHPIDGKNIWPLIAGDDDAESPHEAYFFYYGRQLQAVRMGKWKLHFPHAYRTLSGRPGGTGGTPVPYDQARIGLSLFDLDQDIGETRNVADQNPDVVRRIQALADRMRRELGDSATDQEGTGVRAAGRLEAGDQRFPWKVGEPLSPEPIMKITSG